MNGTEWFYLLVPIVTGYLASAFCHVGKDAGRTINARPPAWVFGLMWPVLYLLVGYSWVVMRRKDPNVDWVFWVNVVGLVSWILVYGCGGNKRGGVWILLATVVAALMLWGTAVKSKTQGPMLYLAPYVGWLVFALMLNFTEVNKM
jgi:tryptophan-rich sensory protein